MGGGGSRPARVTGTAACAYSHMSDNAAQSCIGIQRVHDGGAIVRFGRMG